MAVSPASSGVTGRSAVSSIHFVMGADVDQEEDLRPGLGMFLFGEDDPTIVGGGTGMEASQWAAQVVGFQARIGQVRRHPPQGLFNLGWSVGFLRTTR